MHHLATLVQTMYRGWYAMTRFKKMKKGAILIASQFRGYQVGMFDFIGVKEGVIHSKDCFQELYFSLLNVI